MRAFVTGATGFLGRRLVPQLLDQGLEVRCLTRSDSDLDTLRRTAGSAASGRLEFVPGSLSRIEAEAFRNVDVVYHLAAAMTGATAVLFANNVIATRRLIAEARRAQVGRLVLVSSLAVYDSGRLRAGDVLDERCPLDPQPHRRDPYTYSKVAQEQAARDACHAGGPPLVVVRPGVIYGPGRDCLSTRVGIRLGNFLLAMGGRQRLPYTYVENCARAVMLAGLVPGVEDEAFNVVDDAPPTARGLLKQYRRAVGRPWTLTIPGPAIGPLSRLCEGYHQWSKGQLPAVLTPYKSRAMWTPLVYSNAKAKAALGWAPRVGFSEGLRQTFDELRRHDNRNAIQGDHTSAVTGSDRDERRIVPIADDGKVGARSRERPMRILAITSNYPRPGHETSGSYNRQQFHALADGHELVVLAPVPWTEELKDRWAGRPVLHEHRDAAGLRVLYPRYYFPPKMLQHLYGKYYLASIRSTAERLIREFRPDVLLASFAHPDGWAAVHLAREAGLPVVVKVVGSDVLVAGLRGNRRKRIAEGLGQADAVVAVSNDLANHVVKMGVDPKRVHVVHEGIDHSLFSPGDRGGSRLRLGLQADLPLVLFVGNLLLSKGAGLLIHACRILADRRLRFSCHLVGRGRDERRIRALVARLRLGDRIHFAGPRSHAELVDWYRASDVVALPSYSEGIPNVLREAAACGRPFVATRVGGIPEIADESVSRLVTPGSVEELADALQSTLESPPAPEAVLEQTRAVEWDESARQLAGHLRNAIRTSLGPRESPPLRSAVPVTAKPCL